MTKMMRLDRSPACQTILDAIGNLLADGRQVEEFLFAEAIFGLFGNLPIHRRLVPKIIIPIHAWHCVRLLLMAQGHSSPWASHHHPEPLRDLPHQDILIMFGCRGATQTPT